MTIETLLHLGSRSFSHFLNATERYLDVLRYLSPDPTSRRILLDGVSNYWRYSSQQRLVTMDKYIQYGVLEGLDVVDWIFAEESRSASGEDGDGWTDGENWELQRMCLDKHVGRVTALRNRMRAVEREDEAARARRAAEKLEQGEGVGEGDEAEPEGQCCLVSQASADGRHRCPDRPVENGSGYPSFTRYSDVKTGENLCSNRQALRRGSVTMVL